MNAAALQYSRSAGRPGRLSLDPVLVCCVLALLLIGLVMVTSASMPIAERAGDPFFHLKKQLLFAGVGLAVAMAAFSVRSELWDRWSLGLLLIAIGLLVLVMVPGAGYVANGARRWLRLGFFNFQASELARVLVVMYLCSFAVRYREELTGSVRGLLKPLALLAVCMLLLLAEPDFGAASVLFATGLMILFIAGLQWRYVLGGLLLSGLAFGFAAFSSDYRMERFRIFLDPWADPFNKGFQLTQSLIAIGRGEWFGVGLGASVQKLSYLPEPHTDFVFAVMAEELGLVSVVIVVLLFLVLIWRAFRISRLAARAGQMFQSYLAAAFGIWIGLQAFINIGVNMGVLPTKGLTLPLMSYGGSSLLVTLLWLGVLLRIHHECAQAGRLAIPRGESAA
jgi:cell division protein FtsW